MLNFQITALLAILFWEALSSVAANPLIQRAGNSGVIDALLRLPVLSPASGPRGLGKRQACSDGGTLCSDGKLFPPPIRWSLIISCSLPRRLL